eukprot:scaffold2093_cov241-Pinguiococcus_pyrenoidosus.AAC.2
MHQIPAGSIMTRPVLASYGQTRTALLACFLCLALRVGQAKSGCSVGTEDVASSGFWKIGDTQTSGALSLGLRVKHQSPTARAIS